MENKKKEMIADHAILTEENFLLSAQVAKSFEEIMNRRVGELLKKLEADLKKVLGPKWETESSFNENSFDRWYFILYKKEWVVNERALYYFGFAPEKRKLDEFHFYAMRDVTVMKKPVDAVYQALNEQYKPGRKGTVSDWYQYIDQDYLNWTNDETLVKLYRQAAMIEYLIEQFIKMKDIIEPIVDAEVKKTANRSLIKSHKQLSPG